MPEISVDHIEMFVRDRDRAADWYGRVLGLEIIPEYAGWAEAGPLFIGNHDRTVKIALISGTRDTDGSINRVAFGMSGSGFLDFVSGIDAMRLRRAGRVITARDIVDHGMSYSVYFDDPDGNRLELTCYDHDRVKSGI